MKRLAVAASVLLASPAMAAGPLICAQNESTFQMMCFHKDRVRSNGEVRAAKIYRGGPKSIEETPFTARVHCVSGVLELTDREGVAFGREVPGPQLGKDFVRFMCAHAPTKHDPKLKTR